MTEHDTLTLGELIAKLRVLDPPQREKPVRFSPHGVMPFIEKLRSWRGRYEELTLCPVEHAGWKYIGTGAQLLDILELAIGRDFEGYKGGTYTMDSDTPVWADAYGESMGRSILDVKAHPAGTEIVTDGRTKYDHELEAEAEFVNALAAAQGHERQRAEAADGLLPDERTSEHGCWVAYQSDRSAVHVFETELDALRAAVDEMGQVHFVPWGCEAVTGVRSDRGGR